MTSTFDDRLTRLKSELGDHSRIARYLDLDFERPIRSLGDGYPENAVSLVGKITERLLKQLWRHHEITGDPSTKALNDLIKGCQPHIHSSQVMDALSDIKRFRNRSTHDGYEVEEEDGLAAVRCLLKVLEWFTTTGSAALDGSGTELTPVVARRTEFLSGLYMTMGYRLVKSFALSTTTVYRLFCREVGVRHEYVELMLTSDVDELERVLGSTGGELLQTNLPKLTRFLIVEEDDATPHLPEWFNRTDYRVVTYDGFLDTIVDVDKHLTRVTSDSTSFPPAEPFQLTGDILRTDVRSGEMRHDRVGDAHHLLEDFAGASANLLMVGRPGSGKTTLLQHLVTDSAAASARRYRFYLDLRLKNPDEDFSAFVTRMIAPCMSVEYSAVFEVFNYLIRSGSVLCALDGIDEAVTETTLDGFLALFAELAQVLSAESTVVMSSRVSFVEDSPHMRQLMDARALAPEKLVQQLYARGVDPLRIPQFSILKLHNVTTADGHEGSPLELQLADTYGNDVDQHQADQALTHLVVEYVRDMVEATDHDDISALADFVGRALLEGRSTFSLLDICNTLGTRLFPAGRIDYDSFALRDLFTRVDEHSVTLRHSVFHEFLAAEYLRTTRGREHACEQPRLRLPEQVRAFLHATNPGTEHDSANDCVLQPDTYVVGPSHHLLLRRVPRPLRFDRHTVTVGRYKQFLAAISEHGSSEWDHPDMPTDRTHEPWHDRLRVPEYYDDPAYEDYPAICVSWWSAYAFARFEGKRLPTALEWEAAARGNDGRLFPWGDELDLEAVNCADAWSGRPLITFETWQEENASGRLRNALPTPVTDHPRNTSPIGLRGMVGNVWEWTSTVFETNNEAAICGGSFDNPYRAVQTSSKGLFGRRGSSNVVGFRCVEELD